jgi:tetratricopeptide (TPR) repeat protein
MTLDKVKNIMAKLFFSYSHKDEELRNELETHLALLKRQGVLSSWHDRRITAGSDFDQTISSELESSQIVLLLVSAHFLASDYCYEKEMIRSLEKHEDGSAVVIPVILHPCDWHSAPFGHLRATPTDGKPVSMYANQQEAFAIVAKDVREAAKSDPAPESTPKDEQEFVESETYIYPKPSFYFTGRNNDLQHFKKAIESYCIVSIEGLGGIGKTEFASKCVEMYLSEKPIVWFDCIPDSKIEFLITQAGFSEVIKGENKTELARYSGFTSLIEKNKLILILDNFQDLEDNSFESFLSFASRRLNQARIILVSRTHVRIRDVELFPVRLSGLGDDSIQLAKQLIQSKYIDVKIDDNELRNVCKSVNGHPLAIKLALQLLNYGELPYEIIQKIVELEDDTEQLSSRLLDAIFKHPKSKESEKSFMLQFSIFRRPIPLNYINAVIDIEDIPHNLYSLIDKLMINCSEGLYNTHPLVREFCYKILEDKSAVHIRAAGYLITNRPSLFDPIYEEEIFFHYYQAGLNKECADLISDVGRFFIHTGNTDSLRQMLDSVQMEDDEFPEFFIFYGDIAQIKGDWDNALKYFKRAFSVSNVNENVQAEGIIKYGEMLWRKGKLSEALKYFKQGLEICRKIKYRRYEARALNDIGLCYYKFGKLDLAKKMYGEALKIYENIDDIKAIGIREGHANTLINIAHLLHDIGDAINAEERSKESLLINQEIGNKEGIALYHSTVCINKHDTGDYQDAKKEILRCMEICEEIGHRSGIASGHNRLALVLLRMNDINDALLSCKKALDISIEIGNRHEQALSMHYNGAILLHVGKCQDAIEKYEASVKIFEDMNDVKHIGYCSFENGLAYRRIGNFPKTIEKLLKFEAIKQKTELDFKHDIIPVLTTIFSEIGLVKFNKITTEAYNQMPIDSKQYINLNEITQYFSTRKKSLKIGKNDPCPCMSGKKYKKCCLIRKGQV